MTQHSKSFNFDSFDDWLTTEVESAERINEDARLCLEGIENSILYREWSGEETPPEAA